MKKRKNAHLRISKESWANCKKMNVETCEHSPAEWKSIPKRRLPSIKQATHSITGAKKKHKMMKKRKTRGGAAPEHSG